jgi:acetylornithine deacetylase/succinyl-diaminopimelate desuccinylase-like protein
MTLDVIETLCDLVRLPSVNPMGRSAVGDIYFERRVTDFLENKARELNLPFERWPTAPQRDNLIIRVDGDVPPEGGGRILMLEAHQDTVPIDGMTIPPFEPEVRDGRVYGRGACDIKSGLAAMLTVVSRLAKEKPSGRATVVLACTVNEEHGFSGASHWADAYCGPRNGASRSRLLPRVPDEVVVAEPTRLNVVVAHKGAVRWRCHTGGRATHSSQPHLGDNALFHMARVLAALERYAKDTVGGLGIHPLVGSPTLSVGTITGGISVNTVPDHCTIEIDRRVLPGEDPLAAYQHVIDWLAANVPPHTPVTHDEPFLMSRGLADDRNTELADRLSQVIRRHGGPGERIGVPFGTDAPLYAATGCPAVVFGAGDIAQAHTADEWIAIDQVRASTEILFELACG